MRNDKQHAEKRCAAMHILDDVRLLEENLAWIKTVFKRATVAELAGNRDYAEFLLGQIAKIASEYDLGSKTDREKLTYTGDHAVDYIAGRVKNYGHRKP